MSTVVYLNPQRGRSTKVIQPAVYTVPELAALLSLDLGTTYEHLRNGLIPAKRVGRRWIIPRQRIHDWLESTDDDHVPDESYRLPRQKGGRA